MAFADAFFGVTSNLLGGAGCVGVIISHSTITCKAKGLFGHIVSKVHFVSITSIPTTAREKADKASKIVKGSKSKSQERQPKTQND